MSYQHFLTDHVIIGRLTAVSGDKTRFLTLTTSIDSHIQQIEDRKAVELGGAVGKLFKIFFDLDVDIQEGDMITAVNNQQRYQVIAGGVRKIDNIGISQHIEVLVKRVDD